MNSNNEPKFPGAIISIQREHSSSPLRVQTDSAGHFQFRHLKAGLYEVKAELIGFDRVTFPLTLTKDTAITISLRSHATEQDLNEVVVSAAKPAINDSPDKLVYNVSSSVTATGADVLTTLAKVPGVKVNDNEISIAGKGALKVMINDRLVQLSGLELIRYLKSMSANQVSKIEVLKNPGARYDAEGNAGLINITTKQSKKQGYSGNIQANGKYMLYSPAEAFGTRNYEAANLSANLQYNTTRWSAYGSVNLDQDHHLEGFETTLSYPRQTWMQGDTGDYKYRNINVVAGVDYQVNKNLAIGINYQGAKNVYDGSDHVHNPIYNNKNGNLDSVLRTYATYYPEASSNSINLHSLIKLDSSGSKLLLNADYINYYRTDKSDFESHNYPGSDLQHPFRTTRYYDNNKQNFNIYTFKADAEIPTSFAKIMFGTKLSFIDNYSNAFYYKKGPQGELTYDTDLSNEFDYKENTQALYLSLNKEAGKWKYEAGLRGELTQTKGYSHTLDQTTVNRYFRLFPSLSVSYQANTDNSLALTIGKRVNRPSFWNLNPFKSLYTAYSYGEGNPYLNPEYSTNFEVSHTYKNMLTSALFFNVTNNGFNNLIIASVDTNLVYTKPLNFLRTYRYGISENIALQLFSWLDNNNQATFYYTQAQSTLPFIKDINGFGLYLATNNNIWLNKSKTFAAAVNAWYQFPEVDHIGKADAYYKVDMGLKASVMKKKMDIALTLNDIFLTSANTVTSTINGVPQKFSNFQLNRFLLLGLTYRFGSSEHKEVNKDTGNEEERGRIH
ncbi:MAG: TonB-dependent receptor [Chitinophaga sp.]|nr:TonB-dependent receptor [Chitinophaga sp.]